jgi:hypothetical protein
MIERGERNISLSNMAVFAKVFELNLSELLNFNFKIRNHIKIIKQKLKSNVKKTLIYLDIVQQRH